MQPGDVKRTFADIDQLVSLTGVSPNTSIEEGMKKFVDWFIEYNCIRAV